MMSASPNFCIVCMKCNPEFHRVNNGKMTLTLDGDLIIECSTCGHMEKYIFNKK